MKAISDRVRARLREVVGANEPAEKLAASWALGVTIGLSPLLGLHTVIAILLAVAFRLNKLDVLLGTLIINPWTLAVYFPSAVAIGRWLTGLHVPRIILPHPSQLFDAQTWAHQRSWLQPLLVCWGIGATGVALICGAVTFYIVRAAILARRRHHRPQ